MTRSPLEQRRLIANTLLALALCGCALLLVDPPTQSSLYPACPIRQFLGIKCPGCGATRALAALLRGHFVEAFRLNALFVLLLPAAFAATSVTYRRAIGSESFRWPTLPAPALYATLALAALFTLVRNLPS